MLLLLLLARGPLHVKWSRVEKAGELVRGQGEAEGGHEEGWLRARGEGAREAVEGGGKQVEGGALLVPGPPLLLLLSVSLGLRLLILYLRSREQSELVEIFPGASNGRKLLS